MFLESIATSNEVLGGLYGPRHYVDKAYMHLGLPVPSVRQAPLA